MNEITFEQRSSVVVFYNILEDNEVIGKMSPYMDTFWTVHSDTDKYTDEQLAELVKSKLADSAPTLKLKNITLP